REREKERES
ncbi:Protein of unknown function, partial [Gryllus bimaculatus]